MHGIVKKKKPYVTLRSQLAQRNEDVRRLNVQLNELRSRLDIKRYIDKQSALDKDYKDYQLKVLDQQNMLQKEIDRLMENVSDLKIENWQLKGALGYEVPGHIRPGDFHCGLCEAKSETLIEVQKRYDDALERLEECDTMKIKLEYATELLRR